MATAPSADSRTCQIAAASPRVADDVVRARAQGREPRAELLCLRVGLLGRPRAELDEQRSFAERQQLELVETHAFGAKRIGYGVVESFEANRLVRQDGGHVIGRDERVGKSDAHETAERRACREAKRRFEHRHAGALAADQRTSHVEALFGQQLVKVVTGHAARDAREFFTDERGEPIADAFQAGVNLSLAAAGADDRLELGVARGADAHPRPVIQHHLERVDVVDGLSSHQGVHAARVVADHAAERATAVRRRIGRKRQVVHFGRITNAIEHDAGLHARHLRRRIERDDAVQVLRKVHDDRNVTALAGEAGACAARHDRGGHFAARRHRRYHVGFVERDHQSDRHLPIVGRVGRIQRTRAVVEAHLAADRVFQLSLERISGRELVARMHV